MSPNSQQKETVPPISIRLTFEERQSLEQAAEGMTISAYIRERLFGEKVAKRKKRGIEPIKDHRALARLLGMLGKTKIANNLNQLARDANRSALIFDEETERQITEAYGHIQSMRAELIRALGLMGDAGK